MELFNNRTWFTDQSTIGELFFDEDPTIKSYLLEPTIRANKDPRGIVAIPEGRYEITMYDSPKNKRRVPILNDVPGHSYVEMHIGNFPKDTEDCLLFGMGMGTDCVTESEVAFNLIVPQIDDFLSTERVFLNIKNGNGATPS